MLLDRLLRRLERIVRAELDRQHLSALDDRLLDDLGVARDSIEDIARSAARPPDAPRPSYGATHGAFRQAEQS